MPNTSKDFHFEIRAGLEEDRVWSNSVLPAVGDLPLNVIDIWHYRVTEMVNNAIDHSGGSALMVFVNSQPTHSHVEVRDNGIGIFRKIKSELNLPDEQNAILELSKGKLTTDPERHSGQGIFFVSRMLDKFKILSSGAYFSHDVERARDYIVDDDSPEDGTLVVMDLDNTTPRTLKEVFDQYSSGENYDFSKTVVPISLAKFGNEKLISRSQAKRALSRIDQFKAVVFDFNGIDMIGQAFADEIFRVWAKAHPEVECFVVYASPAVRRTIATVPPAPNVRL